MPIVYIVLIATIIINVQRMYILIIPMMKHTVKEVEVVWACDQKRGTLFRKECDCNESTGGEGREEDLREDDWTK